MPVPKKYKGDRTYLSWLMMRRRCLDKNYDKYHYYGGRGISVCERWVSYDSFLEDMGSRPDGHTLDRIDVDGDYEPQNCRWVDHYFQSNNRRNNIVIEWRGEKKTLKQWARILNLPYKSIWYRYKSGWNVEKMLTQEIRNAKS